MLAKFENLKILVLLLVFNSTCKELGSEHFILTRKKLKILKIQ